MSPPLPKHIETLRAEVARCVRDATGGITKGALARFLQVDGADRVAFKVLLRDMEQARDIFRGQSKRYYGEPVADNSLPAVTVLRVVHVMRSGTVLAEAEASMPPVAPSASPTATHPMVRIEAPPMRLNTGDRVLVRCTDTGHTQENRPLYKGKIIRRLPAMVGAGKGDGPNAAVRGLLESNETGGYRLIPVHKKAPSIPIQINHSDAGNAQAGDFVEVMPHATDAVRRGQRKPLSGKVTRLLHKGDKPHAISAIAVLEHELPEVFSDATLDEAGKANAAPVTGREDLRALPFVTIDGADARDFDDAVWAAPDEDADNPNGWRVIVAIADVAWYVQPGSALDEDARTRSNSVYFPDRVIPMLPEALSNGWCSLIENEDRPVLVAHLWLDRTGIMVRHRFSRAVIRSHARLTYEYVERALWGDGATDLPCPAPVLSADELRTRVLQPLASAYEALRRARTVRGALNLEVPERRVVLNEAGHVVSLEVRQHLRSHQLIEEMMVCANVAAAETLEKAFGLCLYRVHDEPSLEKLTALRDYLSTTPYPFAKGQVMRAQVFNRILERAGDANDKDAIHTAILRTQSQAEYSPLDRGHFGLSLRRYCHFTSPIRRYSDLVVHRALLASMHTGTTRKKMTDALPDYDELERLGAQLSAGERRAATAERDTVERYYAQYMQHHIGGEFQARINGVTRAGLFVTLLENNADGLLPMRSLPDDYYFLDEKTRSLTGERSRRVFAVGDSLNVRLSDVSTASGGLLVQLLDDGGNDDGPSRTPRLRKKSPKGKKHKRTGAKRSVKKPPIKRTQA